MMMVVNSGLQEAPPTRKPSMSGIEPRSLQFLAFTEPIYKMRTPSATALPQRSRITLRTWKCVSCACMGDATTPVPMAHTGSYAMEILDQSMSVLIAAFNCRAQTSTVTPVCRSCSVSPMASITFMPAFKPSSTLIAVSSSVSPYRARRSECPTSTHFVPKSASWPIETSPVKAPSPDLLKFSAPMLMALPSTSFMAWAMCRNGVKSTVSAASALAPQPLKAVSNSLVYATVFIDFQLPPTIGFRNMPFSARRRC
mmetsp:Transcript_68320/g.195976  ORF Transcript_68320/g.195976 Transcript_68320/m.195976 type:complete len:255 (-) Transcript_68320:193-957(-)